MARSTEVSTHGIPAPPDQEGWRHFGDGIAGRIVAARMQGYDPVGLGYVDVAVNSSGQMVAQLAADPTIDIGTVDQGTAGSSPWLFALPTGASTSAKQDTGNTSLASIDTKLTNPLPVSWASAQHVIVDTAPTTAVTGTFWQATQPVSGAFFQATQPVSIASMPSTPVTGAFFQATQPVSLTTLPALTTGSAVIGHVIVDSGTLGSVTFASPQHVIVDSGTENVTVQNASIAVTGSLGRSWTLAPATDSVAVTSTQLPTLGPAAMSAALPVTFAYDTDDLAITLLRALLLRLDLLLSQFTGSYSPPDTLSI